jgi:alkanesulfonate monooxygenase SsuD/methylene tetrahydromethanopterin reductase-like flavin-dependent oxidoreductase (luciferase family)
MELAICVRNLTAAELTAAGRFAEDNGFAEVFVPDSARGGALDAQGRLGGRDAFIGFAAMLSATKTVKATVGVAAVPMHNRLVLPNLASTLQELSGGRFSLGLGVSHPEQTARLGVEFPARQIDYMREWIRDLTSRSRDGMTFGAGWPVMLAALGPRMVRLGAEEADGLVLNWLTPEHAAKSVEAVRQAAPAGAKPRVALYLRLMTAETAHNDAVRYDAMANYHRNFLAQGLDDHAAVVTHTTLPRDDIGAARDRIEEYRSAGIDTLCIYPVGFEADDRRALESLTR